MYFEGFLRALQSDIWGTVLGLAILGVGFLVLKSIFRRPEDTKWLKRVTLGIGSMVVGVTLIHACSVAAVNRMPRHDVDESAHPNMNH